MNIADIKKGIRLGKRKKRLGRGIGSGHGKTSCRGHKGLTSRKGSKLRPTYEGGQSPLFARTAKRGFSNAKYRKDYSIVNISRLELVTDVSEIDVAGFRARGWLDTLENGGVKVLGEGKISRKLKVKAQAFSRSARAAIEAAGGSCEIVPLEG